jgi:hypothetical protein
MTLPKPVLDNRTFAQLVGEGVAQLHRLAPDWTDYNASDPGITLLELFAWLSEQNLYRTDRVTPEMSRAFLRLVGVTPQPASVATTVVMVATSSAHAVSLPDRVQLADSRGAVPFETREPLTVSTAKLVQVLAGFAPAIDVTADNEQPFDRSKDPRAGSFQPFGKEPQPGAALYLGFDGALGNPGDPISLHLWSTTPADDAQTAAALRREWEDSYSEAERACPKGQTALLPDWHLHYAAGSRWEFHAESDSWLPLPDVRDETRALTLTGFIRFAVPRGHVPGGPGPRWFIRCRLVCGGFECSRWIDHIGINAVTAEHAVSREAPEVLGTSRGHAAEAYDTAGTPVVAGSTRLTLAFGNERDHRWSEALEWDLVGAHDRRYRLEPERGRITSGNGLRGAVFPAGFRVLLDYRVGGGPEGNIAAGTLASLAETSWNRTCIADYAGAAASLSATQRYAASGGAAAETLAAAEARAIADQARPCKAVSLADFEALALAVPGVPVGRAKALANHYPDLPCFDAPGSITAIVVPDCPGPAPMPGPAFLHAVECFLHRRRPVTTELHVVAPHYVEVTVRAALQAGAATDPARLARLAQQSLDEFFNPLAGGPEGGGWPIGRGVYRTEVMTILAALPGVLTVSGLTLQADDGPPTCDNIAICAGDLIRSGKHGIEINITGTTLFSRSQERVCA